MRRHILAPAACACALLVAAPQSERPPSLRGLVPYWTAIHDASDHCRYSIPPTWQTNGSGSLEIAQAPDGSVTIEQWWLRADWPLYRNDVRHVLAPVAVHEDSAQRLYFDYAAGWPGDHLFVAVPAASGVCATHIDIRPGARTALQSTLQQIITSIVALE